MGRRGGARARVRVRARVGRDREPARAGGPHARGHDHPFPFLQPGRPPPGCCKDNAGAGATVRAPRIPLQLRVGAFPEGGACLRVEPHAARDDGGGKAQPKVGQVARDGHLRWPRDVGRWRPLAAKHRRCGAHLPFVDLADLRDGLFELLLRLAKGAPARQPRTSRRAQLATQQAARQHVARRERPWQSRERKRIQSSYAADNAALNAAFHATSANTGPAKGTWGPCRESKKEFYYGLSQKGCPVPPSSFCKSQKGCP